MTLKHWLFFILLSTAIPAVADEVAKKITVMTPSRASSTGAITISSDSKLVQDFLKKRKAGNTNKPNNNLVHGTASGARVSASRNESDGHKKSKSEDPVIVHLNSADSQPPVKNKTERFIFQDITARSSSALLQSEDLAKRTTKIESLRQMAARHQ